MAKKKHVHDEETVTCEEGLSLIHGHLGHRSKYPHTPGPPPPPEAKPRGSLAVSPDLPRRTIRYEVL